MKKKVLISFLITLSFFSIAQNNNTQILKTQKENSIEKIDVELSANQTSNDRNTRWIDAMQLSVEGVGWKDSIENYTRLPNQYKDTVTKNVWNLSRHSAGISIHFSVSGTTFIEAKWTLVENRYMAHMTPQAINGLDLYVRLGGKWQWAGIGKPDNNGLNQHALLKKGFSSDKTYECLLYLPLYTGISDLLLGFSPQATVGHVERKGKKPLVFYGTSILHGCSASRAGMPFSSMLGRHFDRPVINLGFSGNGLMEAHFAKILAEIDASVYIIDCLPNMSRFSQDEVYKRTLTLVRELHTIKPQTPIILVEDRSYTHPNLTGEIIHNTRRVALKAAYQKLKKEIRKIDYVEGELLLGSDNEATVDGSHPSDLGMYRYFSVLKAPISKALRNNVK